MRASVIGSGSFGTALANVLAVNCEHVGLWGRDAVLAEALNTHHENATYLPGIPLSPRRAGHHPPGARRSRARSWWCSPPPATPRAR